MPFSSHVLITLLALASYAIADPIDWVNIEYLCNTQSPSTEDAQNALIQGARSTAAKGPWTVTSTKSMAASGAASADYLSYAPYHWPDCNWCSNSGRVHLVHDGNRTNDGGSTSGDDEDSNFEDEAVRSLDKSVTRRRMTRKRRNDVSMASVAEGNVPGPQAPLGSLPSAVPDSAPSLSTSPTTTTAVARTSAPPQAAAKCTPSPTKSMPASATWTTCPYVARDGKVNPDVRTLSKTAAINDASQGIFYNAIAGALQASSASASASATCFKNVASFIDTFFLTASTAMTPNMKFGQVVRGPDTYKSGTFTGILDLRGFVKICNAIGLLKAIGNSQWTDHRDKTMNAWTKQYLNWLDASDLGQSAASKPNNHGTFHAAQVAACKMLLGDSDGAVQTIQSYFKGPFLQQIASSGEQPLEAVRTRPYHYRCFNLEAMITLAKMGDQLGLDCWTFKSKYGATIQDAVNFVMKTDPKTEDQTEALPHVAAVAAVYEDPDGKYADFMSQTMSNYQKQPFWYYNQPDAFTEAPGAQWQKREDAVGNTTIPFVCPSDYVLPDGEEGVELDDGIYAACAVLKDLYEKPVVADA
ncbi:chondroitin AC/alginate lyase [Mycena vitilis]|nr:chondroitin AC/alginate lyase [Mycena vitilis]